MPVIGFLYSQSAAALTDVVAAFQQGLNDMASSRAATSRSSTVGRTIKRSVAGAGGRSGPPTGGRDRGNRSCGQLAAKSAPRPCRSSFVIGGDPVESGSRRQPQPAGGAISPA